jgi:Mg/Co/Ni transporter MgtE
MKESKQKILSVFFKEHAESAASTIAKLDDSSISQLVHSFDAQDLVAVFNRTPAQMLSEGMIEVENALVAKLFSLLEVTLSARILKSWINQGSAQKSEEVLLLIEEDVSSMIKDLIEYSDDEVGSRMNPTPFTVSMDYTLEAVAEILKKQRNRYSRYIYVVGPRKELLGVIPFKEIYYQDLNLLVSEVMSSTVRSLNVNSSIENALEDRSWRMWDSMPVVDSDNILQGVIKYDVLSAYTPAHSIVQNTELNKAGEAVGEVLKIGIKATMSVIGIDNVKYKN